MKRRPAEAVFFVLMSFIILLKCFGFDFDAGEKGKAALDAGKEVWIEGRVISARYSDDELTRIVVERNNGSKIVISLIGKYSEYWTLPGRQIKLNAETELPSNETNPGCFDYADHLSSLDIYLTGTGRVENLTAGSIDGNFFKGRIINWVSVFRFKFYDCLCKAAGAEAAGLFSGMLFGDKDRMSEDMYEGFRENGTAHILSVSGLHVGIIYGVISLLMGRRRKSRAAACLTMVMLAGCGLLASFSISVMRAIFMIGIHIAAPFLSRRFDLCSSAFVMASVFLFINPNMIYNTGFILSFSAVLSLSVIGGGINRRITRQNLFTRIMVPILSIQIGIAPINALIFNCFSLSAFVANIPVIFLSGIMIPMGMLLSLLILFAGVLPPLESLTELLSEAAGHMAEMLIFFNDVSGLGGNMAFNVASPSIFIIAVYYFIIYLIFSETIFLYPLNRKTLILSTIMILLAFAGGILQDSLRPQIVFVDVGQGDCIHIRTPSGKNILVDGGGSAFGDYDVGQKILLPYLLKNGVTKLDGVIVSHMDKDHYLGLASLSREMDISKVILYEGYKNSLDELCGEFGMKPEDVIFVKENDILMLDKEVNLEMIFPKKVTNLKWWEIDNNYEEESLNAYSLVMMLDYRGTEVLLTGDIGNEEEKLLYDNQCDIVKVPHHGSAYSSSDKFIKSTKAKAAVFQVGNNNFGHPADSVIERYEENGIIIFRNDIDGAVMVKIFRGGWKIYGLGEKARNLTVEN